MCLSARSLGFSHDPREEYPGEAYRASSDQGQPISLRSRIQCRPPRRVSRAGLESEWPSFLSRQHLQACVRRAQRLDRTLSSSWLRAVADWQASAPSLGHGYTRSRRFCGLLYQLMVRKRIGMGPLAVEPLLRQRHRFLSLPLSPPLWPLRPLAMFDWLGAAHGGTCHAVEIGTRLGGGRKTSKREVAVCRTSSYAAYQRQQFTWKVSVTP